MVKEVKIRNCVVFCDTHSHFILEQIATKLYDAEYNPESFPGLVYRLKNPKATILVFSTGKFICSGTTSLEEAEKAIRKALEDFKKVGIKVGDKLDLGIVNMVASADLGYKLDLNSIVFTLPDCEYEPEQFPGVVHKIDNPKLVFLLFSSGRIVVTGAKSEEQIHEGIAKLEEELREYGLAPKQ